jgi:hypothetical protein
LCGDRLGRRFIHALLGWPFLFYGLGRGGRGFRDRRCLRRRLLFLRGGREHGDG